MKKKPNNIMRDEEKWITDQFPRPQADGNYTNSGSRADSNPQPQESWEIDIFNEVDFRIEDGILEIWRRASPDGDWEGRTGTTKELKDAIRTLLEDQQGELYAWFNKALLKQKKEIIEEFIIGKRCLVCGKLKERINVDICDKCFNEK